MVTQVTFFISSELLSMPAVKRFSVSFAKHPTNGTSASLQVYFHFLHLPSFCMSMETSFHFGNLCWFCFLSRDFCHVSFDFSSFIIFLNIQPASYPSHTPLSLSETSCGQLSLSPSYSVLISLRMTVCVDEFKHVFVFPVLVCAQVCGAVGV